MIYIKNIEVLFIENKEYSTHQLNLKEKNKLKLSIIQNKEYCYKFKKCETSGKSLKLIIDIINDILDIDKALGCKNKLKLKLDLHLLYFRDKTTILIFDSILYYLITLSNRNEIDFTYDITWNPHKMYTSTDITDGFTYFMTLQRLLRTDNLLSKEGKKLYQNESNKKFIELYEDDSYLPHEDKDKILIRKLIPYSDKTRMGNINNIVCQSIRSSLRSLKNDRFIKKLTKSLNELIDNVIQHTNSDVLIDIIATKFKDDKKFYIDASIIAIDNKKIYSELQTLFDTKDDIDKLGDNYRIFNNIYKKYKADNLFDSNYTVEHFFMVLAFQKGISSRFNKDRNNIVSESGTGLPSLIKNLHDDKTQSDIYVLSGNAILELKSDLLDMDTDQKYYPFNSAKDINLKPDASALNKSDFFFPGTVFNLCITKEYQDE